MLLTCWVKGKPYWGVIARLPQILSASAQASIEFAFTDSKSVCKGAHSALRQAQGPFGEFQLAGRVHFHSNFHAITFIFPPLAVYIYIIKIRRIYLQGI